MTLLERNLRLELSQVDPIKALFELTLLIKKDTVPENLIRLFGTTIFEDITTDTYKALSKELVETGKITSPN